MNVDKICQICGVKNATRICDDCLPPYKLICEDCLSKRHNGFSTKNHTFRDIRSNAIIVKRQTESQATEKDLPEPLRSLFQNSNSSDSEPNKMDELDKYDVIKDISSGFIDDPIEKKVEQSFFMYSTDSISDHCILFDSNKITEFKTLEQLASALKIKEEVDNFRVPIISFLTKPLKDEKSLANILLFRNSPVKFIEGRNISQCPMCSMLYDSNNNVLVLETQNMYKKVVEHLDSQNILMNLLLALSDVIVFSETGRKRDFIQIHETMKECKSKYNSYYAKVNKSKPQLLAPGIIYIKSKLSANIESLSTSIQDETGRDQLFHSFSEIVYFNKESFNDNQNFISGLRNILDNISNYRNCHSMEDILTCIKNCCKSDCEINCSLSPDTWFICGISCEICNVKCTKSFCHLGDHENDNECLSNGYNDIYYCKVCHSSNGKMSVPLVLKQMSKEEMFLTTIIFYPIRGRIVECDVHGIIYNQYWSNDEKVYTKFCHKWPGKDLMSQKVYPIGQTLVDKVNEISQPVCRLVRQSTEYISDVIQPEDWQSTRGTFNCGCCNKDFKLKMEKHHCRTCKKVICSTCCTPNQSYPICETCSHQNLSGTHSIDIEPKGIVFLNLIRDTVNYSSSVMKKVVTTFIRPDYWEPDEKVLRCFNCKADFHCEMNPIHHCRACGKCVCHSCSEERKIVEWRYIFTPSRVCDPCIKSQNWKTPI